MTINSRRRMLVMSIGQGIRPQPAHIDPKGRRNRPEGLVKSGRKTDRQVVGVKGDRAMDAEMLSCRAYRFDCFVLDLNRGALLALDGTELPLRPKSFALFQLLVENAGRLLDRDTIMEVVWPDVFVTDDSITQCVGGFRQLSGQLAEKAVGG
jgi:DNA-binding response OmpR family regulator